MININVVNNSIFEDCVFENCRLCGIGIAADFKKCKLINCDFSKGSMINTRFVNTYVDRCVFVDTEIQDSEIHHSRFQHCNFSLATLDILVISYSTLAGFYEKESWEPFISLEKNVESVVNIEKTYQA